MVGTSSAKYRPGSLTGPIALGQIHARPCMPVRCGWSQSPRVALAGIDGVEGDGEQHVRELAQAGIGLLCVPGEGLFIGARCFSDAKLTYTVDTIFLILTQI